MSVVDNNLDEKIAKHLIILKKSLTKQELIYLLMKLNGEKFMQFVNNEWPRNLFKENQ